MARSAERLRPRLVLRCSVFQRARLTGYLVLVFRISQGSFLRLPVPITVSLVSLASGSMCTNQQKKKHHHLREVVPNRDSRKALFVVYMIVCHLLIFRPFLQQTTFFFPLPATRNLKGQFGGQKILLFIFFWGSAVRVLFPFWSDVVLCRALFLLAFNISHHIFRDIIG